MENITPDRLVAVLTVLALVAVLAVWAARERLEHVARKRRAQRRPIFKHQRDGTLSESAKAILNGAVIGIYADNTATCTAVFISEQEALTVFHDSRPGLCQVFTGKSAPARTVPAARDAQIASAPAAPAALDSEFVPGVTKWKFEVTGFSEQHDLVLLKLISGPKPTAWLTISAGQTIDSCMGMRILLASHGIAIAANAGEAAASIPVGTSVSVSYVSAVGHRHFAYGSIAGPGYSGSAVVNVCGNLVGLHLGGWNHAATPMPLSPRASSIGDLAHNITVGGYAVSLNPSLIDALRRQAVPVSPPLAATGAASAATNDAGAASAAANDAGAASAATGDASAPRKRSGRCS